MVLFQFYVVAWCKLMQAEVSTDDLQACNWYFRSSKLSFMLKRASTYRISQVQQVQHSREKAFIIIAKSSRLWNFENSKILKIISGIKSQKSFYFSFMLLLNASWFSPKSLHGWSPSLLLVLKIFQLIAHVEETIHIGSLKASKCNFLERKLSS